MGGQNLQVPRDKEDLFDTSLENTLLKIGGHQLFLDLSRAPHLTSGVFSILRECSSLLFLDVSYTAFHDLEVLTKHCLNLKGTTLLTCSVE